MFPGNDTVWGIVFGALAVAGFWLAGYIDDGRSKTKQKDAAKRKLNELRDTGQVISHITEARLTTKDVSKLNAQKWGLMVIYLIACLIIPVVVIVLLESEVAQWWTLPVEILVVVATLTLLYWLKRSDFDKRTRDIATQNKHVVRGFVTDKIIETDEDRPDNYFLQIDSVRVPVSHRIYTKYEVGDGAEIHYFPPQHNFLLYEAKLTI